MKDSKAAEQGAIGCILLEPEKAMPAVLQLLGVEDFQTPECRNIYGICKALFMQQKPIDLLMVLDALGGGAEYKVYLTRLIQAVFDARNIGAYAQIIAENACRCRALAKATELQTALMMDIPVDDCRGIAAAATQILNLERDSSTVSPPDGFMLTYNALSTPRTYMRTGFCWLDRLTYIDRGDYVVVGGRPSAGKTALTLQIMLHMSREHKAVYFSLETKAKKIYDRLLSLYSRTPFQSIKTGNVKDYTNIAAAYDSFSKRKFSVVEAAGWTVEKIKAKAIQENAEIIFIDYLSLIKSPEKNMTERVTQISIDLHTLAQTANIAVVALSQLNREGAADPQTTNLRESGQIEQDADVVLLLSSMRDAEENMRRLRIAKNKEGKIGNVLFTFDGDYQHFTETETRNLGGYQKEE